ncbi:hypothetical protein B0T14DRAFT_317552 [Immersiella caudata]|uniref:Secreted protein n=1 Tax=Immersiella caudata TaxID=314043 RepID=A0AA39U4R3_9PEZI|nr:hypothetical protein B0T14DRAFT_317552 [Immersiella caudata]
MSGWQKGATWKLLTCLGASTSGLKNGGHLTDCGCGIVSTGVTGGVQRGADDRMPAFAVAGSLNKERGVMWGTALHPRKCLCLQDGISPMIQPNERCLD